tara:strand:+ start:483 stop:1394 length:912 start_codon:yes stop_codon:yes gene_type:complete
MDLKSKIILISGPTASGKSTFAINLAKKINGEIINADSMQVYKQFKILTARPTLKEQKNIKHHLYGFLSIKNSFSSGQWLKLASKKIKEIQKRNKTPILVGGTGLYFKILIDGLVKIPKISKEKRNKIINLQKKIGQNNFYKKLIKIDPNARELINLNDFQRSIRAYEVKYFTNKSLTEWYKETKPIFRRENFVKIYLDCPKDLLFKRIKMRAKKMIPLGLIEVKKLKKIKIPQGNSSNKIIGYSELRNLLAKRVNTNQTIDLIATKTRQYAKRQATWARGQMKDWKFLSTSNTKISLKKLLN